MRRMQISRTYFPTIEASDREVTRVGIHLEANLADTVDHVPPLATAPGERIDPMRLEAREARCVIADAADHPADREQR